MSILDIHNLATSNNVHFWYQ